MCQDKECEVDIIDCSYCAEYFVKYEGKYLPLQCGSCEEIASTAKHLRNLAEFARLLEEQ